MASTMTRLILIPILKFVLLSPLFCSVVIASDNSVPVSQILKQTQPPAGILFEIVSDNDDLLEQLLPDIESAIKKLRNRFPGLPIAIVTHGKEQFALMSKNRENESKTHSLAKKLTDDDIDVHVCGTHASWYGVMPEEFPDYIDVTAAAPTQIDDYEEMGYELIVLTD